MGGGEEPRRGVEEEVEGGGEGRGEEDLEASCFDPRLDFVILTFYLNLQAINSDAICNGLYGVLGLYLASNLARPILVRRWWFISVGSRFVLVSVIKYSFY